MPLMKSVRAGLAFRLMIGAGVRPQPLADDSPSILAGRVFTQLPRCVCQMSKVGGNSSDCWQELSCTTTHYFTQPMPNPLAWWAHQMPEVRTTNFRAGESIASEQRGRLDYLGRAYLPG